MGWIMSVQGDTSAVGRAQASGPTLDLAAIAVWVGGATLPWVVIFAALRSLIAAFG
jgi:hypothetical protein